jgi:hypothetical protein
MVLHNTDEQGISTECRYVITPPSEVVLVDLDMK